MVQYVGAGIRTYPPDKENKVKNKDVEIQTSLPQ